MSEDTYRGQTYDPLSLNLYTYCHNEPIMYTDPTGHVEEKDAFIFDKKTKDKIQKATDSYNQATKDYKDGKISKEEMKSRQSSAHQDAVDARNEYAKDHTKYANITTSVDNGKTVYTMSGGEQYIVVNNKIQEKPSNSINSYKGDVDSKLEININIKVDLYINSKYADGKYNRNAAVTYATNPSYSSPGKGGAGFGKQYFETKNRNSNYIRFDNLDGRIATAIAFISPGAFGASDCANFSSQALAAGGIKMTEDWQYTGINPKKEDPCTHQWSSVKSQYDYFSNSGNGYIDGDVLKIESYEEMQLYVASNQMRSGDLLYWEENGDVHHSTMITGFNQDNEILYSGHSIDRINQPVAQTQFTANNQTLRVVRIKDYAAR